MSRQRREKGIGFSVVIVPLATQGQDVHALQDDRGMMGAAKGVANASIVQNQQFGREGRDTRTPVGERTPD